MRLVVATKDPLTLSLPYILQEGGHDVKVMFNPAREFPSFKNILSFSTMPDNAPELVIIASTGLLDQAEALRKAGYNVIGGDYFRENLVNNDYQRHLAKIMGVDFLPGENKGTQVAVSCWFNGKDFEKHTASFFVEDRGLMEGGRGPLCHAGFTGVLGAEGKLLSTLYRLTTILRASNFVGFITINYDINKSRKNKKRCIRSIVSHWQDVAHLHVAREKSAEYLLKGSWVGCTFPKYISATLVSVPPYPYPQGLLLELGNWQDYCNYPISILKADEGYFSLLMGAVGYSIGVGEIRDLAHGESKRIAQLANKAEVQFRGDVGHDFLSMEEKFRKWDYLR